MILTARFHSLLQRAEQISKENNLDCVDSYCMGKAMLEGDPYNIVYLAFMNLGYNPSRMVEELDRINAMRGPLTQAIQANVAPTVKLEQKS